MIMGWIWTLMLIISVCAAVYNGLADTLAPAAIQGAQSGVTLAISISGSLLLWSGVGKLMERSGLTDLLSALLHPLLYRLFPSSKTDIKVRGFISANICANFLGLGNAATPMGIHAAKKLADPARPGIATDELCRLVVLNTASIQLIPTSVAAVRLSLGCSSPFDILPAVWITSLCAASLGLAAAGLMGKLWRHD